MKSRVATAAVCTAIAGSFLLVAGCGGGDGGESNDEIAGVGRGEESPSASESAADPEPESTPGDGIERPEIQLPDRVVNDFEEAGTDDPVELAVIADNQRHINAVDQAVTSGDADSPALSFYARDDALLADLQYIEGMHEDNLSFTGTTRYYNYTVEIREEDAAALVYCMDGSESHTVNMESGETEEDSGARYLYSARLERNGEGVWQTVSFSSNEETARC